MPKIEIEIDIHLPKPPNFIRHGKGGDGHAVDVADLSTEQLNAIAKAWTEQLHSHAQARRDERVRLQDCALRMRGARA